VDHIEFRPPLAARVLVGVFCGGFDCALLIEGIVQGTKNADAGGIVLGVLLMTAVAALGWRLARQAAIIDGDELVVRNFLREHRIRRNEVLGLGHGKTSTGGQGVETIVVETTSGSVPLDVLTTFEANRPWARLSPGSIRRSERAMLVLSAWKDRASVNDLQLPQ